MTTVYDLALDIRAELHDALSPDFEISEEAYDKAVDRVVRLLSLAGKNLSDGHHTFGELYRYRLLYNAALFNEWGRLGLYDVHKSLLHHDGKIPFGDAKWFIVVAELPTGQISNHYRLATDWDLFNIEARGLPNVYDGHTPDIAAARLDLFLRNSKRDA